MRHARVPSMRQGEPRNRNPNANPRRAIRLFRLAFVKGRAKEVRVFEDVRGWRPAARKVDLERRATGLWSEGAPLCRGRRLFRASGSQSTVSAPLSNRERVRVVGCALPKLVVAAHFNGLHEARATGRASRHSAPAAPNKTLAGARRPSRQMAPCSPGLFASKSEGSSAASGSRSARRARSRPVQRRDRVGRLWSGRPRAAIEHVHSSRLG